tara:strand:+ start:583 stop:1185 length:603 start_codon:yes stop_codon:yes gene_type:complete
MIEHEVKQGESDWFDAKLGVLSASQMSSVFTATGKSSSSRRSVIHKLVTEIYTGEPVPTFKNADMQRGNDLEKDAALTFSMKTSQDLREVGFFTTDDGRIGASPDRLFEDTGVEIKCPRYHNHLNYLEGEKCPTDYFPQIQTTMFVMGMDRYFFCSYYPRLPLFVHEVRRDDEWISGMIKEVDIFFDELEELKEKLKNDD